MEDFEYNKIDVGDKVLFVYNNSLNRGYVYKITEARVIIRIADSNWNEAKTTINLYKKTIHPSQVYVIQ